MVWICLKIGWICDNLIPRIQLETFELNNCKVYGNFELWAGFLICHKKTIFRLSCCCPPTVLYRWKTFWWTKQIVWVNSITWFYRADKWRKYGKTFLSIDKWSEFHDLSIKNFHWFSEFFFHILGPIIDHCASWNFAGC